MRAGSRSSTTIVREVRPRFLVPRTFQRTIYRPGELVQCDLWEPSEHVPVGHGQRRRGWVVTCEVCWSRVIAGTLIFSKEAPDILWGLARNLQRLGVLPEKLVWDRESAIAAGGRPTEPFAAFCGQLEVGWVILEAAGSAGEGRCWSARTGSCARTSSRAACSRTTSTSRTASTRGPRRPTAGCIGRSGRSRPSGWPRSRRGCGRCPRGCPTSTAARSCGCRRSRSSGSIATTTRSTRAFAGRRVEVRVSQTEITAVVLDTGELAARHRRVFAGGLTLVDPAHQTRLERQRERAPPAPRGRGRDPAAVAL